MVIDYKFKDTMKIVFSGVVVGFVLGFVIMSAVKVSNDKRRDAAIDKGYTVFLDGVEVDTGKLDVDKYGFSIDDENQCVMLNSK